LPQLREVIVQHAIQLIYKPLLSVLCTLILLP